MIFHHVGIACKDIEKELAKLKKIHLIIEQSDIVFDPLQNVHLCMITTEGSFKMELVAGETVEPFLKKGITNYHLCYETENIEEEIKRLIANGALLVSASKPAVLFDGKHVAFLYVSYGLIELVQK